jgi:hypothetical protein
MKKCLMSFSFTNKGKKAVIVRALVSKVTSYKADVLSVQLPTLINEVAIQGA